MRKSEEIEEFEEIEEIEEIEEAEENWGKMRKVLIARKVRKIEQVKSFLFPLIFILLIALSTKASGQGSLYFSKIFFSSEPAFTPILIEQLLSFAAFRISLTLSIDPIFPGFILKQLAPDSADSMALL